MRHKLNHILIFSLTLLLSSCFLNEYDGEIIKSPTGQFEIKTSVNRTDREQNDFAEVIIHLFDQTNNKISEIKTGAGDQNKWAIGWTIKGDTIILQSSDIGNKAWTINKNKTIEIKMTIDLNERAKELKEKKYK